MNNLVISLSIVSLFLAQCQIGSSKKPENNGADTSLIKSGPANDELLETLQGRWQSLTDSTYVLEFLGTKMIHFNNGTQSAETEIEVNADCKSTACTVPEGTQADGWCFIEKDQNGAQCNIVVKCDRKVLQYSAVGSAGATLSFKRL
ncbi:MAG: hypothetical protein WCR52_08820 [Bacteroidota bacterium]